MSDMTLYDRDGRVVTQGALNQLMGQIDGYKACIDRRKELQKDVADLSRLLRDVGWGQGEIDTAAVVCEENERLRDALRKAEKMARLACKYYDEWYGRGYSGDGGQIAYDLKCYAANIAQEAEAVLNPESEGER